jgi:hypothetical protein
MAALIPIGKGFFSWSDDFCIEYNVFEFNTEKANC